MNDHPLFPDENAAPLGSNGRASEGHDDCSGSEPVARPPAHSHAPAGTSEVAADLIATSAPRLESRVFAFIVGRGPHGATDDEGENALNLRARTYTPRRWQLVKDGLVVDSGCRRKTASGRPAAVWIAARFASDSPPPAAPGTGGGT